MAAEDNVKLVKRFIEEAWNSRNIDVIDEIVAEDHRNYDPASPWVPEGREGLREFLTTFQNAFPNARLDIQESFAQGDRVCTRWTARGTNEDSLMGIPPTNEVVTTSGIQIDVVRNGRITETYVNWDTLGFMQQLGAVPELPTPTA